MDLKFTIAPFEPVFNCTVLVAPQTGSIWITPDSDPHSALPVAGEGFTQSYAGCIRVFYVFVDSCCRFQWVFAVAWWVRFWGVGVRLWVVVVRLYFLDLDCI